jgi:hypothetical protein
MNKLAPIHPERHVGHYQRPEEQTVRLSIRGDLMTDAHSRKARPHHPQAPHTTYNQHSEQCDLARVPPMLKISA